MIWSSSVTLCNLRGQKVDLKFTQQNMQSVALQSSYDHGGITLNHKTRERGNFIFHATLPKSLHLTFAKSFFFSLISAFNSHNGLCRKRETACRLLLSLQSLRNDDGDAVDNVCVKIPIQFQSTYDIESKMLYFTPNAIESGIKMIILIQ